MKIFGINMWFITFVILQVLFASGIVSAEDEISTEMILDVLCNDDNAETASIAVECFDAQDTEDFHPALKSCKGIDEVNSETMKEWYCSHTLEEIQSADDCAAEMMEDNKEAYFKFLKDFKSCVDSKMGDEKKRK